MIVNRRILLLLLVMASLVGCYAAQDNENYGIVEAADDLGNLDTFVEAITQADMIDRLNDEGTLNLQNDTYIVFAPNDAAFRGLPSEAWNSIMANEDDLNTLLEYHIVENADLDDIRNLRDVDTLEALDGRDLNLSYNNGLIVNGARVLESRMYSDGIVYVIDRVLLPDDDEFLDKYDLRDLRAGYVTARAVEPVRVAGTTNVTNISERQPMSAAESGLIENLEDEEDLETFTEALTAADLGDEVYNITNLTIFAPDDSAFSVIPENSLNRLLANRDDLRTLLRYHIFDRSNLSDDWDTFRGRLTTLQGGELMINRTDGEFTIDGAEVERTIHSNDSIIYVIDRVLFPEDNEFLDRYDLRDIARNETAS